MADLQGLHVLLVEDNPDERWLLGEILRGRGHTVTACEDGESGWAAYQQTHPPLLILDWLLPGLDGLELCRLIREEGDAPGCVVMVVTSRNSAEDLRLVLNAGADDYVQKPINVSLFEIRLAVAEQRVRNMMEKERTRLALEAKTREMEALFQNLDEVFFSIDVTEDELVQVSPAARELLGIPPEALVRDRRAWMKLLLPPEMHAADDLGRAISLQPALNSEYLLIRPDGKSRWVRSSMKPTLSSDGRVIRLDGVLSDLTARRAVEEEISARNQELQTLHRVLEITLAASEAAAAFRTVLGEVQEATGFPVVFLERLDQKRDRLVITESVGLGLEEDGAVEIPLNQTLSGIAVESCKPLAVDDARTHERFKSDFLRARNLRSYVAFPLLASGSVYGVLTLADTEVREIPLRLLRWGESLANSLALFVERLEAEAALKEGKQEALALAAKLRAANEDLEAFAASVSNELRAPIRTVQGFANALVKEHGDSLPLQARDFATRIIAAGHRSEELIRDLLAYSRLGFEELELHEVDLEQATIQARDEVARDLAERGAVLSIPDVFPKVRANHTTLVQILVNLLSNAIKFVPEDRTPEIRLRWEEAEDEGRIRIWVEDNGIGIREEHRERIFKVFQRLDGELERPGTGIGLALVRRGAERIGGEVGVVSERGAGSSFWVEVPKSQPPRWRPWGGWKGRSDS